MTIQVWWALFINIEQSKKIWLVKNIKVNHRFPLYYRDYYNYYVPLYYEGVADLMTEYKLIEFTENEWNYIKE